MNSEIQILKDELEIRNLQARLAHLADEGDLEDYILLFTEDAVWEGGAFGTKRGVEQIMKGAIARRQGGTSGPGAFTRHVLTTTMIEVDEDNATGKSVFHFYTNINETPVQAIMGVYEDKFQRKSSGWKICYRKIISPNHLVKPK